MGTSYRKVAKLVGVNEKTIRNAMDRRTTRMGTQAPSTPASVVTRMPCVRAAWRLIGKRAPSRRRVRSGGVGGQGGRAGGAARPAWTGLVEVGQQLYGSLKHGYYGLTSMLLSFGLIARAPKD